MSTLNNIVLADLCIYVPSVKLLIVSDIHVGYEEFVNKMGVLSPRVFFEKQLERMKKILGKLRVETVVINGDLKHEYGTISQSEWSHTRQMLRLFKGKRIVLVKGNHDSILEPIADKFKLEIVDYFIVNGILICHGHEIVDIPHGSKIEKIIIGHEHPAVTIQDGVRKEKYKCFLIGKWKRKELIVMPSFILATTGTDVTKENCLSPYLTSIDNFKVFVVEDKIYEFGTVKSLKEN